MGLTPCRVFFCAGGSSCIRAGGHCDHWDAWFALWDMQTGMRCRQIELPPEMVPRDATEFYLDQRVLVILVVGRGIANGDPGLRGEVVLGIVLMSEIPLGQDRFVGSGDGSGAGSIPIVVMDHNLVSKTK